MFKVCNIVFGYGHKIGNDLITHPEVNLISFTGGTVTGGRIKAATASQPKKKLSLELGGKNAGIVWLFKKLMHIFD
jgi:acyl-CoA reductase-like NAD-dependent aldehyde dehydrogenase